MYTQYINEERMNLISFKRIMVYLQNPIISNYRYFKSMEYLSNDLYEINVSLSQSYSLHQKKKTLRIQKVLLKPFVTKYEGLYISFSSTAIQQIQQIQQMTDYIAAI